MPSVPTKCTQLPSYRMVSVYEGACALIGLNLFDTDISRVRGRVCQLGQVRN